MEKITLLNQQKKIQHAGWFTGGIYITVSSYTNYRCLRPHPRASGRTVHSGQCRACAHAEATPPGVQSWYNPISAPHRVSFFCKKTKLIPVSFFILRCDFQAEIIMAVFEYNLQLELYRFVSGYHFYHFVLLVIRFKYRTTLVEI